MGKIVENLLFFLPEKNIHLLDQFLLKAPGAKHLVGL